MNRAAAHKRSLLNELPPRGRRVSADLHGSSVVYRIKTTGFGLMHHASSRQEPGKHQAEPDHSFPVGKIRKSAACLEN
ncbi:hypothetical protein C8R31_101549 [Nitrosospira sp. Nsp2]|nr:hypothetical protein C8R31_101549 [Nitrosospira sp. Nsp2]